MDERDHELYPLYESMWQQSLQGAQRGEIACDNHALQKDADRRRGMTVIARLEPGVLQRIGMFLKVIQNIEPRQYYYPLTDIHLTVLTLFTATAQHQPYLARAAEYAEAVTAALASAAAFSLDTIGITLTSSAVLTQGFPHDAALAQLRDQLRAALNAQGLGGGLDQRYSLRTAHSTVIRFTEPLRAAERFAEALHQYRHTPFGRSTISALELVVNDWYMSSDRLEKLKTYPLGR